MKVIKTPVKGMCDMLPSDMRLRSHVLSMIRDRYARFGFMEIETPVMEHIENLTSRQGGDNEKLIFKVLKRGRDLERAIASGGHDYADNGLRYDLTVPLARYYANNMATLPAPFKAMQIGNVWRADNPQKGRFRQFTQCDIDILGDSSILAEIELITATSDMLSQIFAEIGVRDFTVHVNDRRILRAAARSAGFSEDDIDGVLITLDKLDKIGPEGVQKELAENGAAADVVERYLSYFEHAGDADCAAFCAALDPAQLPDGTADELAEIIDSTQQLTDPHVRILFDPTLVRGMGYYTGPIFEVTIDEYNFSIAGGGRYDAMIGKFSGQETPACGFSIGFERIITILKDHQNATTETGESRCAYLIHKSVGADRRIEVLREAKELRKNGTTVTVLPMKKNMKAQIQRLEEEGYTDFRKVYDD